MFGRFVVRLDLRMESNKHVFPRDWTMFCSNVSPILDLVVNMIKRFECAFEEIFQSC